MGIRVHNRQLDGKIVELGVSGLVRRGNLVMYDKETDTLFLQETGEALEGALEGTSLQEIPKGQWKHARWDEWRAEHPDTLVWYCDHCQALLPKGATPQ